MSSDSTGIPPDIREVLVQPPNSAAALEAMELFISKGDEAAFEQAIALFVASARSRDEPIEAVLGVLSDLATDLEGPRVQAEVLLHPTTMHTLIFAGILRAFYGNIAVDRGIGARAQRKADASQHVKSGTWPKRPGDL